MDKYIGKLLDGRYEILEVIGVGGMAVVYKAMCHRLNRLVAIKILKDDYSRDEEFRRRFHGESQAVAMMSHPNIVNVYDVSRNEGLDYIVMELIDGITLKQYMERKGALSWRETLHFSMQIAKALEHAHGRGIIHRDIKPHNIMILKDGSVKVADFGIARVASAQNTLTKEALGSVHYISPEQARGGRVDNRTDLYSLGVVMYQMLTGRPPYDGDTPVSVAIQHINGTPLMPSLLAQNIPTGLEQITMHAMCADLNLRYASATDMLRDMEELRKNPSILFQFGAAAGPAASAPQQPRQPRPGQQPRQPRPGQQSVVAQQPVRTERPSPGKVQEGKDKRTTVIIIAACAVLAVIGICVLVGILLSGQNRNGKDGDQPSISETIDEIEMPKFEGLIWDESMREEYPYLDFVVDYEYNDEIEEGIVIRQDVAEGMVVKVPKTIKLVVSKGEQGKMPDLINKSQEYAVQYFDGMGVKVLTEEEYNDTTEAGHIIRTEPIAGQPLKDGQIVTIYVSKGAKPVEVPRLVNMELSVAQSVLEELNLKYSVSREYNDDYEKDRVISQSPNSGEEVSEGTVIVLVVSDGKKPVTMINVVGMDYQSAKSTLEDMNLKVKIERSNNSAPADTVYDQSVSKGAELSPGQEVILYVSDGPEVPSSEPTEPPATDVTDAG